MAKSDIAPTTQDAVIVILREVDGVTIHCWGYVTRKYFIASPREQGEGSVEVAHSWGVVEVVFGPILGNVRYYQRTMKCSEEAAYAEAYPAMVVGAVVPDTQAERDDIQQVAEAMPVVSEEDFLAPATEVQEVEVDENS